MMVGLFPARIQPTMSPDSALFRLNNKVVAVTGAAAGIGKAIAQLFAARGAKVYVLDVSIGEAQSVAKEINNSGGQATAVPCDVADSASVQKAFREILSRERLDILVNNAGISHVGNLEKTLPADFDRIFEVNVRGMYHCLGACVPHMRENGGGVILNMASIAATTGIPDRFAYSMSKGAVVAMTLSVARDYLADNIRCNCISPARVHTPFVDGFLRKNYPGRESEMFQRLAAAQPIGRMGKPGEVAMLALYLCSDEASFITGVDYSIDGGFVNLRI